MHRIVADDGSIARVQTWGVDAPVPPAVEQLLGFSWPRETGAVAGGPGLATVIVVGPSEWLVCYAERPRPALAAELNAAFMETSYRATDVSQALVRVQIGGAAAYRLLGKGCSLDLDTTLFAVGRSARTRLAGIPVVISRTGDFSFDCLLTRSHGEYFGAWLEDAALEFLGA
jgi:heterotetrameric sarcosine oxidase gamma subunit